MASFTLNWTPNIAPNISAQRAYYRQRNIGGLYLTGGFTPANDLSTTDETVERTGLLTNTVYQFKIANLCDDGGPVFNTGGAVEMIEFECISPTITVTANSINVAYTNLPPDINSIIMNLLGEESPIVSVAGGATSYKFEGLDSGADYDLDISFGAIVNGEQYYDPSPCPYTVSTVDEVCNAPASLGITGQQPNMLWIPNTTVCETTGGFDVIKTITGMSSPLNSWYDQVTSKAFIADQDDTNGNVMWFNPTTATVYADMIHSATVNQQELYNNFIDTVYRRIYFVGRNSGGLLVYDIDTDTTSIVAFGTNGISYNRIGLTVTAGNIYCTIGTGSGVTSIVIINRFGLTISSTLTAALLPTPSHFTGGQFQIIEVGLELYVISSNGSNSTVGVYTSSLTTNLANIVLPGALVWSGAKFWQIGYYDAVSNQFYVHDIGSNKRHVIDPVTRVVLETRLEVNNLGKTNTILTWTKNPITNELYTLKKAVNSSSDSGIGVRTYLEDRTTFQYLQMYKDQYFDRLQLIYGTDSMIGTDAGVPYWSGNPAYNTDGKVTILSTSAGSDNTGRKIVITLKEVDGNNSNAPTGQIKINSLSDPDYIPPYIDLVGCPLTVGTICPTDIISTYLGGSGTIQYELSLPDSVINNPAVDIIEIQSFNTSTLLVEGTIDTYTAPFSDNYFNGVLSGLAGPAYTVQIRYLTAPSTLIQTC